MENPIIILGGMGPQASLELHRLIISKASCYTTRPDNYPPIIHASLAIPDFIENRQDVDKAISIIRSSYALLPLSKAVSIGMACNTAHLLLDELPELAQVNFVSMIDKVVAKLRQQGVKKVGILASPFTIHSRLYHQPLARVGIEVLSVTEDELPEVASIIRSVVGGINPRLLRPRLNRLAQTLINNCAETILLGCTELPLVGLDVQLPTLSSLDVLATALLERHLAHIHFS